MEQAKSPRRQIAEALMKCVERQFPVAGMVGALFALRTADWAVDHALLWFICVLAVIAVITGYVMSTAMCCAKDVAVQISHPRLRKVALASVYVFAFAATITTLGCTAHIAKAALRDRMGHQSDARLK